MKKIDSIIAHFTELAMKMTKQERIMRVIHLSVAQELRKSTFEEDLELAAIQALRASLGELDDVRETQKQHPDIFQWKEHHHV